MVWHGGCDVLTSVSSAVKVIKLVFLRHRRWAKISYSVGLCQVFFAVVRVRPEPTLYV